MSFTAIDGYRISVEPSDTLGSSWIVRVYRKKFLFKKVVSTDWFLDRLQAERYAAQVAVELRTDRGSTLIASRAPGWTLRTPGH
jgi:hypothetical protein